MPETYLVSLNLKNMLNDCIVISSPDGKGVSAKAEEIFLNKCKEIDPKFATFDEDDIEDILADGYYESGEFTVCINMVMNHVRI